MAGAYCKFCGFRCFVYRIVPDGPRKGWGGHMATCRRGMELDLKVLRHTHLTAVNPVTEPDLADAIAAEVAGEQGRRAAALAVDAGQFAEFENQVSAMLPGLAPAPGAGRMPDAEWLGIALALRDQPGDWPLVKAYWDTARQMMSGA